jgi:hypothetical protein
MEAFANPVRAPLQPPEATGTMRRQPDTVGHAGNQAALHRLSKAPAQPQARLDIGTANDPLEHQTARVADQVLRTNSAAGGEPKAAPPIVHEVLRGPGQPLPPVVRGSMEAMLAQDFADVRVHTGTRAGESAEAVSAQAYTVGRHVVFAPGRFEPGTAAGQRLLAHELTHVAGHRPAAPTPSGTLRISAPGDTAERHATAVAEGRAAPTTMATSMAQLHRQPAKVTLTGVSVGATLNGAAVTTDRFTVPMESGVALKATMTPSNATDVTLSILSDTATIAAGTKIDNTTGAITVAADQTGGNAKVQAAQPDGTTKATFVVFTGVPGKLVDKKTSATRIGSTGTYGGLFTHTFTAPAGGLKGAHVNEKFAAAKGNKLSFTGPPLAAKATLNIDVNDPESTTKGWDLDASGGMTTSDRISWADNLADARPFVKNASNPTPTDTLPKELTATQEFRNLSFPSKKYGSALIDSTTHRRALEDRKDGGQDRVKAITSANKVEVVDDYAGPTVFRYASADPASIPAATPAPPGGTAAKPTKSRISVKKDGQSASENFEVKDPKRGCTVDGFGLLTPGTEAGTVTVRVGDGTNFDDVTVTITAPVPAPTKPGATPASGAEESPPAPGPTENPVPAASPATEAAPRETPAAG